MNWELILTCALSSAAVAALITGAKEIILWKLNRKAAVEDREEAKEEQAEDTASALEHHIEDADQKNEEILEMLRELKGALESHISSDIIIERALYKQAIRNLCIEYINAGEIDIDDKKILIELHDVYHYELNGNGYFSELMKTVNSLPVKVTH